jgi:hypothetical protein
LSCFLWQHSTHKSLANLIWQGIMTLTYRCNQMGGPNGHLGSKNLDFAWQKQLFRYKQNALPRNAIGASILVPIRGRGQCITSLLPFYMAVKGD